MRQLYIIKLGGSAITNKKVEKHARVDVIQRLAKEIASIKEKKIIVHGAGSFGHPIVKQYKIHKGFIRRSQLEGFSQTKIQLLELNRMIVDALTKRQVACAPFMPSAFIIAKKGRIIKAELEPLIYLLKLGLTPVLHGDIVYDEALGFSIISGDQIVSYLAKQFKPYLVVFGCNVDGIFDDNPESNPNAHLIKHFTLNDVHHHFVRSIQEQSVPDITGGMAGKLQEAFELAEEGIESVIINITKPGLLIKLINKKPVRCSRILPHPHSRKISLL
ncbi:isopentenyl phosphate kinase [[Eubacterium] cellulosolvens]